MTPATIVVIVIIVVFTLIILVWYITTKSVADSVNAYVDSVRAENGQQQAIEHRERQNGPQYPHAVQSQHRHSITAQVGSSPHHSRHSSNAKSHQSSNRQWHSSQHSYHPDQNWQTCNAPNSRPASNSGWNPYQMGPSEDKPSSQKGSKAGGSRQPSRKGSRAGGSRQASPKGSKAGSKKDEKPTWDTGDAWQTSGGGGAGGNAAGGGTNW